MSGLNSVYDKLDEIPEPYRPLFQEKGGKFELHGVSGLKPESAFTALNEALRKERTDHGAAKAKLGVWGDLKHEDVQSILDSVPELTARANAANDPKKLEELVNARLNTHIAPLDRKLKKYETDMQALVTERDALRGERTQRTIQDAVRSAAAELKVIPGAMEDVLMYAGAVFSVTEDGKVLVKDNATGHTPGLDAKAWLQDMQPKRGHWWPPSQGGGSHGSGGGGGSFAGKSNPWSKEGWNLTQQGQVLKLQGRETAERMATSVGSTIGSTKPPK